MAALRLRLLREGVLLWQIDGACMKLKLGSPLRDAFVQACIGPLGIDADSPYAEAVRELIESYGWAYELGEMQTCTEQRS